MGYKSSRCSLYLPHLVFPLAFLRTLDMTTTDVEVELTEEHLNAPVTVQGAPTLTNVTGAYTKYTKTF